MELNIFQEYWGRFKRPWCVSFSLYLIFVVIVFGGLGVLFSIFSPIDNDLSNIIAQNEDKSLLLQNFKIKHIASNMATYAIATLIPAMITIFLSFLETKNKVSLIIISVVILFFSVFLLYNSTTKESFNALISAILSIVIALIFWVIANHDNEYLNDAAFGEIVERGTRKNHNKDGKWDK